MSISAVPDHLMVNIFCLFPLAEQYRVGLVNKHFHRVSREAISKTRNIDLRDQLLERFTFDDFQRLINFCSKNVRRITLIGNDGSKGSYWLDDRFVDISSSIASPRFTSASNSSDATDENFFSDIGIGINDWKPCRWYQMDRRFVDLLSSSILPCLTSLKICSVGATDENLSEILKNCPNLENLFWSGLSEGAQRTLATIFPDVLCKNLQSLGIGICMEVSFRSLINRCPNLKKFTTYISGSIPTKVLDQFFQTHPHLESLNLVTDQPIINWSQIPNFWLLQLLSLTFTADTFHINVPDGDRFLTAIASSFRHLRHLIVSTSCLDTPSSEIKALSSLKELRTFRIKGKDIGNTDEGIQQMAFRCSHLEMIEIDIYNYTPAQKTFLDLIRFCPHLEWLSIWWVYGADTPQTAVALLTTLSGHLQPRRIKIVMRRNSYAYHEVWDSKQVQDVLEVLAEKGVIIEVHAPERPHMVLH